MPPQIRPDYIPELDLKVVPGIIDELDRKEQEQQ